MASGFPKLHRGLSYGLNYHHKWLFISVFLVSFFSSCEHKKTTYKIAISNKNTSLYTVGKPITELIEKQHSDVQFDRITNTTGSFQNCQKLVDGEVDFAILQNVVAGEVYLKAKAEGKKLNIRTVLPLYEQVLFVIYHDSVPTPKSLPDLIRGKRVGVGPQSSGTAWLMDRIFRDFGIEPDDYTPYYSPFSKNVISDSLDVSCSFTTFQNPRIIRMLTEQGGKLFSLDDVSQVNRGSAVDGFCMKMWAAKPFVIPRNIYYEKPAKPVLTIATDAVLLCRGDIDEIYIHDFVKTIMKNKPFLVHETAVLNSLTENFNKGILNFPLHEGASRYLDRNEPSYLEKYAEAMGFVLSVFLMVLTGGSSLVRWNKQRKKDRIDVYYMKIIEVERHIADMETVEDGEQAIYKLHSLRQKAFQNMVKEKLVADSSFQIFLTLIEGAIGRIREAMEDMERRQKREAEYRQQMALQKQEQERQEEEQQKNQSNTESQLSSETPKPSKSNIELAKR